jgi:Rieske Fe-S protein
MSSVQPPREPRSPGAVGGRADPPDPELVGERVARLTTDALVTRRGYLRILGVLSGGLALGNVAVAAGAFRRATQGADTEVVIVDDADAVPVGGSVRFTYPGDFHPALLLRLEEDLFVAYSAVCTHLQCEVLARLDDDTLYCPCHEGFFEPRTGVPTAGPPERPLPEITLERRGSAIVAIGEGRLHGAGEQEP